MLGSKGTTHAVDIIDCSQHGKFVPAQASRRGYRCWSQQRCHFAGHVREAFNVVDIDAGADISAGAEPVTTRIYAEGICCPSEVPLIRRILEPMAGVAQVRNDPLTVDSVITLTQT